MLLVGICIINIFADFLLECAENYFVNKVSFNKHFVQNIYAFSAEVFTVFDFNDKFVIAYGSQIIKCILKAQYF